MLNLIIIASLSHADEIEVVYKQKTEIDFEAIDIEGQLVKPEGQLVTEREVAVFNPLIRLRMDFDQEISNSVNEIK